jgi:hypothetical protein
MFMSSLLFKKVERSFSFWSHLILFSVFAFSVMVAPVSADSGSVNSVKTGLSGAARAGGLGDFCNDRPLSSCVATLAGTVINVLLELSGLVLLGYILYAGFLWMTSGGETEKAKEARTMIFNAVVGLIILISAFAISSFVFSSLNFISQGGTPPTSTPPAPTNSAPRTTP